MKRALMLAAVLALVAAPVLAEEGRVPNSTLKSLGLGGMQVVSDADGMQVRGMASLDASVRGTSLMFFQLLTPDTKNFLVGSSVNEVDGVLSDPNVTTGTTTLTKTHQVAVLGTLTVIFPDTTIYTGTVTGQAGGVGSISLLFP